MRQTFNEIAKDLGLPTLTLKRVITVHHEDTAHPITVWKKQSADVLGLHHGTNEDGYRWTAVFNGIPQATGNYKPF